MHYYKFNIADYRKDTAHLSIVEHYIYRQLIDWQYLDELPIPLETQSVMRRLCLATQDEASLLNVLGDFFVESKDGWIHERILFEINEYHTMADKNKKNGRNGGRPKKQQLTPEKKPVGSESVTSGNPNHKPLTNNHSKTLPKGNELTPEGGNLANGVPYKKFEYWYKTHCPAQIKIISTSWNPARRNLVKNAWLKKPDEEWWESFFEYCGTVKHLNGENDRGWQASMFWILKPSNFAKVTERTYK